MRVHVSRWVGALFSTTNIMRLLYLYMYKCVLCNSYNQHMALQLCSVSMPVAMGVYI